MGWCSLNIPSCKLLLWRLHFIQHKGFSALTIRLAQSVDVSPSYILRGDRDRTVPDLPVDYVQIIIGTVRKIPLQQLQRQKYKDDMATGMLCIPSFFTGATAIKDEAMRLHNAYAKVKKPEAAGADCSPMAHLNSCMLIKNPEIHETWRKAENKGFHPQSEGKSIN